jgi:DnaJ-class molecular chaperone
MQNYYKTLGLTNAASSAEIRRAYRILARRYHPDVNPNRDTEELFKGIALAYSVLSDPEKKQQYDLELKQSAESFHETFDRAREALKRNQQARAYSRSQRSNTSKEASDTKPSSQANESSESKPKLRPTPSLTYTALKRAVTPALAGLSALPGALTRLHKAARKARSRYASRLQEPTDGVISQIAILELSISMVDAICGMKKTVELSEKPHSTRKISVSIPPGVQTGSIVRFRSKEREREEIVLVIRVENHPWLSLGDRGLTMEIPLTIGEAVDGGKIQVPSFGEPLLVTVEPATRSGTEVRLKGQGLTHRDGTRGDLFIRFVVQIPDSPLLAELRSVTELLAESYSRNVRAHLPKRIIEQ